VVHRCLKGKDNGKKIIVCTLEMAIREFFLLQASKPVVHMIEIAINYRMRFIATNWSHCSKGYLEQMMLFAL
jgi:hypothetical protein